LIVAGGVGELNTVGGGTTELITAGAVDTLPDVTVVVVVGELMTAGDVDWPVVTVVVVGEVMTAEADVFDVPAAVCVVVVVAPLPIETVCVFCMAIITCIQSGLLGSGMKDDVPAVGETVVVVEPGITNGTGSAETGLGIDTRVNCAAGRVIPVVPAEAVRTGGCCVGWSGRSTGTPVLAVVMLGGFHVAEADPPVVAVVVLAFTPTVGANVGRSPPKQTLPSVVIKHMRMVLAVGAGGVPASDPGLMPVGVSERLATVVVEYTSGVVRRTEPLLQTRSALSCALVPPTMPAISAAARAMFPDRS
jgi:hypothetical protein